MTQFWFSKNNLSYSTTGVDQIYVKPAHILQQRYTVIVLPNLSVESKQTD